MARAVTKIETYVGADEGFAPWLFGICRHVVVDIQRQAYRPLPPGLLRSDVDDPGPADGRLLAIPLRTDHDARELDARFGPAAGKLLAAARFKGKPGEIVS